MKTTLLISTYNWPRALQCVLASVQRQTVMPDEIVIADDGSTEETTAVIRDAQGQIAVPIVHVWHEDEGFRKTIILNKAIAQSTGDYIIEVDGDMVLEPHFIEDHVNFSQRGCYVCGSRIKLKDKQTKEILEKKVLRHNIWDLPLGYVLNSIRCKHLRNFLAFRYARKKIGKARGCNMAFWKGDFITVNGYNEDMTGWGREDSELAYRLHFAGVRKKFMKMGGIGYHLNHKCEPKDKLQDNLREEKRVVGGGISRCDNGIDKYLQ